MELQEEHNDEMKRVILSHEQTLADMESQHHQKLEEIVLEYDRRLANQESQHTLIMSNELESLRNDHLQETETLRKQLEDDTVCYSSISDIFIMYSTVGYIDIIYSQLIVSITLPGREIDETGPCE